MNPEMEAMCKECQSLPTTPKPLLSEQQSEKERNTIQFKPQYWGDSLLQKLTSILTNKSTIWAQGPTERPIYADPVTKTHSLSLRVDKAELSQLSETLSHKYSLLDVCHKGMLKWIKIQHGILYETKN